MAAAHDGTADGTAAHAATYGRCDTRQRRIPACTLCSAVLEQHRLPQQRQRQPVRRVLEACDVEHQHRVGDGVVATDRREVAVARLPQRPAGVADAQDTPGGGGAFARDELPKDLLRRLGSARRLDSEPLALCEAHPLVKGQPALGDLVKVDAAVEHLRVVPSPRPLPQLARIHLECVQSGDQRAEPAECRLGLGLEDLGQREEGLHRAERECRLGQRATVRGAESDRGRRKRAAVPASHGRRGFAG